MHQGKVRKCLKELLQLKTIVEIKSADTSRKVYISKEFGLSYFCMLEMNEKRDKELDGSMRRKNKLRKGEEES